MKQIKLTETQKQAIFLDYKNGMSFNDLMVKYDRKRESLRYLLKVRGFHTPTSSEGHRIYPINDNYFENIDTEDKAYFLGLLYADGSNNIGLGTFYISLQEKDKHILEILRDKIQPVKKIKITHSKNINWSNYATLRIHSKKIALDLEKLGCYENKTFKIRFPKFIDNNFIRHFIRGYIDGDGHISKVINDPYVGISSNFIFCEELKYFIEKTLNIHCSILKNKKNNNIGGLSISGRKQVRIFLNYIYKDSNYFLNRKYELWENIEHYNIEKDKPKVLKKCSICDNIHYAKGFCQKHYDKNRIKNN